MVKEGTFLKYWFASRNILLEDIAISYRREKIETPELIAIRMDNDQADRELLQRFLGKGGETI